jgi:hypothetical protein
MDEFSVVYQQIAMLAQVVIKRLKFPNWFIDMDGHTPDPEDYSDGRMDEQKTLRDN